MHIPKTGGLTLRRVIDKQYKKEDIIDLNLKKIKDYGHTLSNKLRTKSFIYGHVRFGVHQYKTGPFQYITMLRDPVERIISTYYFIKENPKNNLHHVVKNMTLEQFVKEDAPRIKKAIENHQTRFVSGKRVPDLEIAKKNLSKHFAVVGITERYNESIFLMKKALGWGDIDYQKINATKSRPKANEISKETVQLIREKNRLDLELYHYGKKLVEKQIQSLNKKEQSELMEYLERMTKQK